MDRVIFSQFLKISLYFSLKKKNKKNKPVMKFFYVHWTVLIE